MTRHLLDSSGPTLRVDDVLSPTEVQTLIAAVALMPLGSEVTIDLTHARQVDALALSRLQREVTRQASVGRKVRLRGITLSQARFLAIMDRRRALAT